MGGRVQKDTNPDMTYLVAKTCKGEKFAYATLFGVPVVSDQWINDAWHNRHVVDFNATDVNFVRHYITLHCINTRTHVGYVINE